MRILLTTTSYQDTPGRHHEVLAASGFEVARGRGPLTEQEMLDLIAAEGPFDATLNGDDKFTPNVIDALLPQCKAIAKYGIGLDTIDVPYCTGKKIPVLFTPGVNHTTVAEHAIGLMIACSKHFWLHLSKVKGGEWKRQTGNELAGKTLGVLGMGRIGRETIKRAIAFDMTPVAYDRFWNDDFTAQYNVKRADSMDDVLKEADIISLHMPATDETRGYLNSERLAMCKDGVIIVNTARGTLLVEEDMAAACKSGKVKAYGTDVLAHEPMQSPHPFDGIENITITPHVGSRTFESVERQALRATHNVINFLNGDSDYIQANEF